MRAYKSLKGGGNWSLKEGKMGLTGKDNETPPGRALFTAREGRVLDEWVPLFSRLTAKVF